MNEHAHPADVEGGSNPHTIENTTDGERADMLAEYLDRIEAEFDARPKLIPLDEEGKAPIIQGKCGLDTPEGRSYITDGDEAVRQIREDGARGFAIYAGKPEHNTEDLVLVDVDDRETFPYEDFPATLMVLSGSARGEHFTYRNGGDVSNASGKDGVDGEVRAHNWYCITPGSVHPSGGVYHIYDDRAIETLRNEDVPKPLRPLTTPTARSGDGNGDSTEWDDTAIDYEPNPDADAKAVIRANTWIAEYLAGVTEPDDRSSRDFAVCRKFAEAGVPEEDARELLTDSNHTKASERGRKYWANTWARAVKKVQDERTGANSDERGRGIATADGGTMSATADGGGPGPGAETEAPSGGDDGLDWATVRELFRSSEKGTSGEATQAAAMRLLEEFDLVTVEENDNIWRYNPETGTFSDDGKARIRKRLADGLNFTYSRSRVTDILHRVRSETYVKRDSLGAPEDMVCVSNGVLDLSDPEDPELLDHSPEYRFTWAMNAPYDPNAEATRFRRFLGESVRPEDITKLQEYAGDALRHWKQPRNLCVLLGPTDAGKGVFMRVLRATFGGDNVASETLKDLTDTRWGAFSLQNRPINLANELSTGSLDNPEKAKNFSGGGDTINVEDKGESKFEMTPTANHLFATNQVPQVSNADEAFYNRWLFVTFPTRVPTEEQDDELDTRMIESEEERAGILNWLLEGYIRRQARTGTGFDGERTIAEKEDMWAAYGDSVDRFIATCVTTDDATSDDSLAKKDAYAVYKTMCNAVGVSVEGQQKLTAELKKEEGVDDSKRTIDAHFDDRDRPPVYTGVRFTDDGEKYLNRALEARRSAEARAETDDEQTGLSDAVDTSRSSEIAQGQAIGALLETIDDMTDEGRGGSVPIEEVVGSVVHRDERARHLIHNKIEDGTLIEDPDGHVRRA